MKKTCGIVLCLLILGAGLGAYGYFLELRERGEADKFTSLLPESFRSYFQGASAPAVVSGSATGQSSSPSAPLPPSVQDDAGFIPDQTGDVAGLITQVAAAPPGYLAGKGLPEPAVEEVSPALPLPAPAEQSPPAASAAVPAAQPAANATAVETNAPASSAVNLPSQRQTRTATADLVEVAAAQIFTDISVEERHEQIASLAGKTLQEVAETLAKRYAGVRPRLWGEVMPGITSRLVDEADDVAGASERSHPAVIALTFDACGGRKGSSYDADLIQFLKDNNIPATLFISSSWLRTNPEIVKELAAEPLFELAAHGTRHKPCSVNGKSVYNIRGTTSFSDLVAEVESNARDITEATGKRPRWFRAGTAYYDDVAVKAIHEMGLGIAGYSVAGDQGATLSIASVASRVLAAKHGDVFLFHMNRPAAGTREGIKRALPELIQNGVTFVRLSDKRVW